MNVTPVQLDALRHMDADPESAIVPVGRVFWSTPSTGYHPGAGLMAVPVWWIDFRTVAALERKQLIRPAMDASIGKRVLTDRGREVLRERTEEESQA